MRWGNILYMVNLNRLVLKKQKSAELENTPLEKSGRTGAAAPILQLRRNGGMRKRARNGGH